MKRTLFIAFIIIPILGLSQTVDPEKNQDRILFYGLTGHQRIMAMEFAAEKFGLEVCGVAGCMVSRKLVDSVNTEHKILWNRMDKRYGLGSKEQFYKDVNTEYKNILLATQVIDNERSIKRIRRKIEKSNEDSSMSLKGKIDEHQYFWFIYSLNRKKYPEEFWHPEYQVTVNLLEKSYFIQKID